MRIFITGIAGFIGMHVAQRLVSDGHTVTGIDNFSDYYDPKLKHARIEQLDPSCRVQRLDVSDAAAVNSAVTAFAPDVVVHLAAQAGVRHSLVDPMAYVQSNVAGHLAVLEACRALGDRLSHLVYASSSSIYGGREKTPFSESDTADAPVSLYAATKRADELMSSAYAHLFGIKQIGLRFFTVYGPWGRPDMAYWSFTDKIFRGEPIWLFNNGDMRRDFTWIGDIVSGVVATVTRDP
ncbi:MAG: NAD-dependent epimerase/dehydratase family protein, partial [Pseudomonadota bacterium]